MQVAKSSTIPSANDVIDFCCRRDFIYKPRIVATFFFQPRAAFELFYSTFSSGFLFSENKSEKNSTSENKYIAATYVLVCTQQKNWDFSNFSKFLEKSQTVCRNRSFCWAPFLLGTLVPPLTLDVINFSKNCNISQFFLLRASLDISHRGVCVIFAYIISRRDVESNGFLTGVSLTPFLLARLSCFPRTQNPLSFPFQTPATQATDKRVFSNKYYPDRG